VPLDDTVIHALQELGFDAGEKEYSAKRDFGSAGRLTLRIVLPADFPARLPAVYVNPSELPRSIAHVDSNGKVCIAPESGILLDTANPSGIVRDAVQRAEKVIRDGLEGHTDKDFVTEFLAYWNDGAQLRAVSLLNVDAPAGPCVFCALEKVVGSIPNGSLFVFAGNHEQAHIWTGKLGGKILKTLPAFFLPLETPIVPPTFGPLDITSLLEDLQRNASRECWGMFQRWLRGVVLPVEVTVVFPVSHGLTLFGFEIHSPSNGHGGRYTFRNGQVRASIEVERAHSGEKFRIDRFDAPFLLTRSGGATMLTTSTITLVGCGSVGSYLAFFLALSGVGRLRLIDKETLTNENVHRHFLGVSDVGKNKCDSLAAKLSQQFPHIEAEARAADLLTLLDTEPSLFRDTLVVLATGDETVELIANERLRTDIATLHCWNDPLGLGGHVLFASPGNIGCYRCCFKRAESGEIYNAASFAAPNQDFLKSFAGCGGGFVPFTFLDSIRTATEAVKVCTGIFTREIRESLLVSWFGSDKYLRDAGYLASPRAALFTPGQAQSCREFVDHSCSVCGVRR
jgi:molybdopterin/thiamine biosynthesis adenylyltransferase